MSNSNYLDSIGLGLVWQKIKALDQARGGVLYVTLSGDSDNGYTADHTFAEIASAYSNGYSIILYSLEMENLFQLIDISTSYNYATFQIFYTDTYDKAVIDYVYYLSSENSVDSWELSTSTLPIPQKVSDLTNDSGFISSYTETDPVFAASTAHGITSSDISNWNDKATVTITTWTSADVT